jgi:tetratricopeptide (TPR) repeat protein
MVSSCTEPEQKKLEEPTVEKKGTQNYALSLSNRSETFHTVNAKASSKMKASLQAKKTVSAPIYASFIGLGRWSREPLETLKKDLAKLAEFELQKGVERSVSDVVKFDFLVAAFQAKEWAEFFLGMEDLQGSSDKRVLSLLANFRGVLALQEGRVPEAGVYFEEALNLNPKSEAAILNLGFLNLKYAYALKAEVLLSQLPEDNLAQSGLLVSFYLQGKYKEADQKCQKILSQFPDHKQNLFNCAHIAFYGLNDRNRARTLIQKFTQLPSLEKSWEEEAFKLLNLLKSTS